MAKTFLPVPHGIVTKANPKRRFFYARKIPIQIPRAASALRRIAIQGRPRRYQYQVRLQQEKGRARFPAYSVPEYLIMHYYQFNISTWILHTSHLTLEEECVYRRLIDFYYDTEKPIPKETKPVIRRLRLVNYEHIVDQILGEYFQLEDDGWHNTRADIEIASYQSKAEKARDNGKKGGRPKKESAIETQSVILANPEETTLKANYKLSTNNYELETSKKDKPTGKPLVTFSRWLEIVKEQNEKPIPEDSPIFEYAKDAGIDPDYLRLAWVEFKARYTDDNKRYKDWRAVFSKAVRGNWFKLWWHDGNGYQLTTLGQQNMIAMKNRDKREQQ